MNFKDKIGNKENPLLLKTPPLTSEFSMHVDQKDGLDILVCTVGKTILHYDYRIIDDMYNYLKSVGDWVEMGSKDEKQESKEGTIEHWGRSKNNPIGGWYGLKKNFRGRVGMYIPPLMEALGLAEITHEKRNNKMRAI